VIGAAESDEREKEDVVVDKLESVDTDLPLPTRPLVTRAGTEDAVLELLTDLDPSLSLRRGGRSISASVGLGTSILDI